MTIKRGDMFYADLSPVVGSEQGGIRPVVIIQNDLGNKYSPTVIAAAITSQTSKTKLPTHIDVDCKTCGLKSDSVILAEQIRTIDKSRLKDARKTAWSRESKLCIRRTPGEISWRKAGERNSVCADE